MTFETWQAGDITLYLGDCLEVLPTLEAGSIDLTVTSPPYDNLRTYDGYTFNFEGIAQELYRVTKPGGVVVWVVGDATIDGSETGTSFKQALYFKEIGFNLHDTMIYATDKPPNNSSRYQSCFEFMFIFSNGKPKVFNPIMELVSSCSATVERKKYKSHAAYQRNTTGEYSGKRRDFTKTKKVKNNIWWIYSAFGANDKLSASHPAVFPEALARDHILSWSNPGDTILDPMMGSGTTGKMAINFQRKFIGSDCSSKYFEIAKKRIAQAQLQMHLPLDIP